MGAGRRCQVNDAIERALRDGAAAYEARSIILTTSLDATLSLATAQPVLDQALYTIFRGLPARLVPGASLLIATHDRAGGDVELIWEARELDHGSLPDVPPLVQGPYGDLLELALVGLDDFCRVRGSHEDTREESGGSSSNFLRLAPHVRRRYLFLIPSLRRDAASWGPSPERD